MSFWA